MPSKSRRTGNTSSNRHEITIDILVGEEIAHRSCSNTSFGGTRETVNKLVKRMVTDLIASAEYLGLRS